MSSFLIALIRFYQHLFSFRPSSCRFSPTCSNYAISAIQKHGILKGILQSIKRISHCHPFAKGGFDPVN